MALGDGGQHHVIGELVSAGLDHDHLLGAAGDGQGQHALLTLLAVGADDILAVGVAHLQADDGAVPGDIGNGKSHRGADHGGDFGGMVVVDRQHRAHNGNVVAHVGGEEGPDLTVDHTGGQRGLFTGAAFSAQEGAGDAADGVEALFIVDAQREEVDAVAGRLGHGGRAEHRRVAEIDQGSAVGQTGDLADLDLERPAGQRGLKHSVLGECSVCDHFCPPFCTECVLALYGPDLST